MAPSPRRRCSRLQASMRHSAAARLSESPRNPSRSISRRAASTPPPSPRPSPHTAPRPAAPHWSLPAAPPRFVILGANHRALELAQAYNRLGVDVAVLDELPALAGEDPELAEIVLDRLRAEGVEIRDNAKIASVVRWG